MQLYAGSSRQFIDDTFQNRIAEKLKESFFQAFRYQAPVSEVRSWQNSLRALSSVLEHAGLTDHGILLEYQLPLSSKRLDCMVTGKGAGRDPNAVIVELKQWDKTAPSYIDDCVVSFVGGRQRDVLHPSKQAGQYRDFLADTHTAFADGGITLDACAYLHNFQFDPTDELFSQKHETIVAQYPLFAGDQSGDLAAFLADRLAHGEGMDVLRDVLASKYRASRKLLDHTATMVTGQSQYVLLDEQLVVFNAVLDQARRGFHDRQKVVMLVHGGPGTGKSVIALNLVGELSRLGYNTQHATGSKAFTGNIRKLVGSRASVQFRFFNSFAQAETNAIDVLIMDEAHRIRETSQNRYTPRHLRSGQPQIQELLNAAKVSVFFIDDRQVVRPAEVGSSDLIRAAAAEAGAQLYEFDLEAQFRCGGSEAFINWVENTLGIRRTANVIWDSTDDFEFRIFDTAQDLEAAIRARNAEGHSARLTAGFCWEWSNPTPTGHLIPDVNLGDWQMPWNARSGEGRLAAGIPKEDFWASDPRGIEQVGCIYTAQGFEFDYAGVIWGPDLRYDPRAGQWIGDLSKSADQVVKRSKDQFVDLVKNTYRVLLTRGMKGCYVYFMDEDTRNFVRSRIE
jgi:DUF2075 family protein